MELLPKALLPPKLELDIVLGLAKDGVTLEVLAVVVTPNADGVGFVF